MRISRKCIVFGFKSRAVTEDLRTAHQSCLGEVAHRVDSICAPINQNLIKRDTQNVLGF
jgi:hypothetical protein